MNTNICICCYGLINAQPVIQTGDKELYCMKVSNEARVLLPRLDALYAFCPHIYFHKCMLLKSSNCKAFSGITAVVCRLTYSYDSENHGFSSFERTAKTREFVAYYLEELLNYCPVRTQKYLRT